MNTSAKSLRIYFMGICGTAMGNAALLARAAGHERVVCEVNADPPNPASDAFHAALGFAEIGATLLPNGKTVRYFMRDLT